MEFFRFQHHMEELMRLPVYQTICPRRLIQVPWINTAELRSYYLTETLFTYLLTIPFTVQHETALRTYLTATHHWLPSMQTYFMDTISDIVYRYFLCDNSTSMSARDGKKQINVSSSGKSK